MIRILWVENDWFMSASGHVLNMLYFGIQATVENSDMIFFGLTFYLSIKHRQRHEYKLSLQKQKQ